MTYMRATKLWIAAAIALSAMALAWGVTFMWNNRGVNVMEQATPKMNTICVGRLLIDLPEGTDVRFAPARVAGINVNVLPGHTETTLTLKVGQREQALRQQKNEYDQTSLEKKIVAQAINFSADILYYAREKPVDMIEFGHTVPGREEGISVEAYGLHNNLLYQFKGVHLASPRFENNVLDLVNKFESRSVEAIPSGPGFCTESGFIHDPIAAKKNESVTMFASLKGHPDITIMLNTAVNVKRIQESLLARHANNHVRLENPSHFKSLRNQVRIVNGIDGEEVGYKVKEFNGTSAHMFTWAGLGKMLDVMAPKITLELHTGKGRPGDPVNSSLSDEAVTALWDKISSSIRLRPTSSSTKTGQTCSKHKAALGAFSATGDICPQSGYWECKEPGIVEGGQRQHCREGENMPPASLQVPPTLWQKMSGAKPSRSSRTVWKLVAYDTPVADSADQLPPPNTSTPDDPDTKGGVA